MLCIPIRVNQYVCHVLYERFVRVLVTCDPIFLYVSSGNYAISDFGRSMLLKSLEDVEEHTVFSVARGNAISPSRHEKGHTGANSIRMRMKC